MDEETVEISVPCERCWSVKQAEKECTYCPDIIDGSVDQIDTMIKNMEKAYMSQFPDLIRLIWKNIKAIKNV